MSKLYDLLDLIFLLWFVGIFYCEANDNKAYNLCMPNEKVVSPELKDTGLIRVHHNRNPPETEVHCQIIFRLCNACRLWLHFKKSSLRNNRRCYPYVTSHCYQDCTYLRVIDETYNKSHAFLFRPGEEFNSISNAVSLTLCNTLRMDLSFEVTFRVESKIQQIDPLRSRTFQSPGFPSGYAMNGEEFMYEIIKPDYVQDMLFTFTDWIMSPSSKLVVYTATTPLTFFGNSSRPVFVSNISIQVTFNTGTKQKKLHQSDIVRGFKVAITCRRFPLSHSLPSTMCGPSVIQLNYGGLLKFSPHGNRNYDCVWVILIHPDFKLVAVQLESFHSRLNPSIEFHEGLTSNGSLVRTVYPGDRFASQNPNGFYIRLQGLMEIGDRFALAYSSSVYADTVCPPYWFRCKNRFCIQFTLRCDGVNHCLDKSDEADCYHKDDRDIVSEHNTSNWSVSIIIPVVITIFIFIILCLFFIFVRRFRKISRGSDPRRQRSVSLSGNVSQQYLHNHFSMNLTLEGDLDAPPSYEDVINTPPTRGNWNLAFNWSQQDLRDTSAPPPYSEYMRENEVNIYNDLADNDTSDLSTIPTDTNNCTDPTSEDQNSVSDPDPEAVHPENTYANICETPTNSLDRWMVDRSTSTSERGIELDADNNKIVAGEPVLSTQVGHEVSAEAPSLGKNPSEDGHQPDRNNGRSLPGADAIKTRAAFVELENPKYNQIRHPPSSAETQFIRATRSRSMDLIPENESNSSLDILHDGQNAANKNGSIPRRNSYPSVIFLTNRQLNSEVFV